MDSFFHNGGTAVALAATTVATIVPVSASIWGRIAAGIATFVVALSAIFDDLVRLREDEHTIPGTGRQGAPE